MTPTPVSTGKDDEVDENKKVKILTKVKTESKKISDFQSKILTKIKKVKKPITNKELEEFFGASKQRVSYSVHQLIRKNLLIKKNGFIYEKRSQNFYAQGMGLALHKVFLKIVAQPSIKKFSKLLKWSKISRLNGSDNYYMNATFDAADCQSDYHRCYGEIKYTVRIQVSKHNCFFYILLDKPPVPHKDYKRAEKDYEFLAIRIANDFTKKKYPKLKKMNLDFGTMIMKVDHYKICDLPKEFDRFNYKDGKGGFIDNSDNRPELEEENREKAQSILDSPKKLKQLQLKIEELEDTVNTNIKSTTKIVDSIRNMMKSIDLRHSGLVSCLKAQNIESDLNHMILKNNLRFYG